MSRETPGPRLDPPPGRPRRASRAGFVVFVAAAVVTVIAASVLGVAVVARRAADQPRPSGQPTVRWAYVADDALIAAAGPGTALAALGELPVRDPVTTPAYSRDVFGHGWTDVDRDGCETRSDVLRRDLTAVVLKPNSGGCIVVSGRLKDPYTGRTINFLEGQATLDVQIDHVVSLPDAWRKGAQQWTAAQRTAFVNDPLDLLAVDAGGRIEKADGDAAAWLPPDTGYRCSYVAGQIAVKVKYRLAVSAAERAAMVHVLAGCVGQQPPDPVPAPYGGALVQSSPSAR